MAFGRHATGTSTSRARSGSPASKSPPQLSAVRQRGASVLLTGHWGDQFLFDDAYLIDLCRRGRWRTAWRHLMTYSEWVDVADTEFKRRLFAALLKYHLPNTMISALRRV